MHGLLGAVLKPRCTRGQKIQSSETSRHSSCDSDLNWKYQEVQVQDARTGGVELDGRLAGGVVRKQYKATGRVKQQPRGRRYESHADRSLIIIVLMYQIGQILPHFGQRKTEGEAPGIFGGLRAFYPAKAIKVSSWQKSVHVR